MCGGARTGSIDGIASRSRAVDVRHKVARGLQSPSQGYQPSTFLNRRVRAPCESAIPEQFGRRVGLDIFTISAQSQAGVPLGVGCR